MTVERKLTELGELGPGEVFLDLVNKEYMMKLYGEYHGDNPDDGGNAVRLDDGMLVHVQESRKIMKVFGSFVVT